MEKKSNTSDHDEQVLVRTEEHFRSAMAVTEKDRFGKTKWHPRVFGGEQFNQDQ